MGSFRPCGFDWPATEHLRNCVRAFSLRHNHTCNAKITKKIFTFARAAVPLGEWFDPVNLALAKCLRRGWARHRVAWTK